MKIGIIENSPIYRKGVCKILAGTYRDLVFSEYNTCEDFINGKNHSSFDLLILGLSTEEQDGLNLLKSIKSLVPACPPILLLSVPKSDHEVVSHIAAGAGGFLTRNSVPSYLLEAVDIMVLKKNIYIESQHLSRIVNFIVSPESKPSSLKLSPRENEIAHYFARGEKIKSISERLNLKPSTVSNIKSKVFLKLKIKSRSELKKVMNVPTENIGLPSFFKEEFQD